MSACLLHTHHLRASQHGLTMLVFVPSFRLFRRACNPELNPKQSHRLSSIVVPLRESSRLLDYLSAHFFPTRCCFLGGNIAGRGLVATRVKELSTSGAALRNKRNQPSCVVLVRSSENSRIESLAGQHALITTKQFPWSVPEGQRMERVGKSCRTPRSRMVSGILNMLLALS